MRKKTEQRASSANRSSRREKISARFPSFERKELPPKQDGIRQLNTEQYLDLLPKNNNNRSLSSVQTNLPEFLHFQSDHLVLSSDRSRGSSAFSLAKSNRQSTNLPSPTPTGATSSHPQSGSSPRASYATGKRSARSRQAHDSTINYGAQPVQAHLARPSSFRQMTSKFDAIGCFHEVSWRVISFADAGRRLASLSSAQAQKTVAGPRGGQMTRTKTHTSTELNSIIIDNDNDDDDDDSWTNSTSKMGEEDWCRWNKSGNEDEAWTRRRHRDSQNGKRTEREKEE